MAISIDRECINSIVSLVFVYAVFFMKKDALLIYVLFDLIATTFAISRHFNQKTHLLFSISKQIVKLMENAPYILH